LVRYPLSSIFIQWPELRQPTPLADLYIVYLHGRNIRGLKILITIMSKQYFQATAAIEFDMFCKYLVSTTKGKGVGSSIEFNRYPVPFGKQFSGIDIKCDIGKLLTQDNLEVLVGVVPPIVQKIDIFLVIAYYPYHIAEIIGSVRHKRQIERKFKIFAETKLFASTQIQSGTLIQDHFVARKPQSVLCMEVARPSQYTGKGTPQGDM